MDQLEKAKEALAAARVTITSLPTLRGSQEALDDAEKDLLEIVCTN